MSVSEAKILEKLRTVYQVFELPDSHPLLREFEERVIDDPSPYLLAIWPTGNGGETIKGTILIPWRRAMRGTFPLKGSYFQVNEVFADYESSEQPIDFPKAWVCNLPKRSLHCGMTTTALFKGATTEEIQHCFSNGYVCLRGFHKKQREARPLNARFHISPCAAGNIGDATL